MEQNIGLEKFMPNRGLTVPVSAAMTKDKFVSVVQDILVPDAVRTLSEHGEPMLFTIFWHPDAKTAGWRQ